MSNNNKDDAVLKSITGFPFVISRPGLEFLKQDDKRSYASADESWLSIYIFQPYWNLVAASLPNWLAPNAVTLSGLIFQLTAYVLTVIYCNNFNAVLPTWLHIANFFGIFLYQTMDAVDGNQARRLKAGSKVGEFLDNFIDIPAMMMGVLCLMAGLQITGYGLYYVVMSLILNHFTILWETNHRRVMNFGVGSNSVTEGQTMLMLIHLSLAYFGLEGSFWTLNLVGKLPFLSAVFPEGLELRVAFVFVLAALFNGFAILQAVVRVFSSPSPWGQSNWEAFKQQVPCITLFVLSEVYIRVSPSNVLFTHTLLFITVLMLIQICVLGNMVLVRQCNEHFSSIQISLIPYIILVANALVAKPWFDEIMGLKIYCAYLAILCIRYGVSTVYQMCTYLNLYFLKINIRKD